MTDIKLTSGQVIVDGPAVIEHGLDVNGPTILHGGLQADAGARILTKLEVEGPALVRAAAGQLPTGVPLTIQIDLGAAILKLQQEVAQLKATIAGGQEDWRWCQKCEGLFFAGHTTHGKCPADGQPHTLQGSGNYRLSLK
jgi:hypothetical protein